MRPTSKHLAAAGGAAAGRTAIGALVFGASVHAAAARSAIEAPALDLVDPSAPQGGTTYEILPDVKLPSKVEDHIKEIAGRYHKATGKILTVTSGTRDASAQAEAIYDKLTAGDDIVKLYKNKDAASELKGVYDRGKADKDDHDTIAAAIAKAIRAQMKRAIFISAHLRQGAADVRSTDMSTSEKQVFIDAAQASGLRVLPETTPPHFHLQLD